MSLSKPLVVGKQPNQTLGKSTKSQSTDGLCLICSQPCAKSRKKTEGLADLKEKVKNCETEKFQRIFQTVKWEEPRNEYYLCKLCNLQILAASKRKGEGKARKTSAADSNLDTSNPELGAPSPKKLRLRDASNNIIPIHACDKCCFCSLECDKKHPSRNSGKLYRIETRTRWFELRGCTPYIKDTTVRERILLLIRECNDPFARDIHYHGACWTKYVLTRRDSSHAQNVSSEEVKEIFIQRVNEYIFKEQEARSLKSLLDEYNRIRHDYNMPPVQCTKSVKSILEQVFGDKIGFHNRVDANKSTIVYDKCGGGGFIEAALHSWGVDDETVLQNAAKTLNKLYGKDEPYKWPPPSQNMDDITQPPELILKFTRWLTKPTKSKFTDTTYTASEITLADLLWSTITRKRTSLQTLLGVTIHGMTKSKVLIQILSAMKLTLTYRDILDLYSAWSLKAIETNNTCSSEITQDIPGVVVLDNDDFREDTLTGGGTSHFTNVCILQPARLANRVDASNEVLRIPTYQERKNLFSSKTTVKPYKTVERGNPKPLRVETEDTYNNETQRHRMFGHALLRHSYSIDSNFREPQTTQTQPIGSYSGFQYSLSPEVEKCKTYFHTSFPKPPDKCTVSTVMDDCVKIAEEKNMPFVQLVGDQPVYSLITEVKAEHPVKYAKVIPILGAFHIEMAFMAAIDKRFKDSGLSCWVAAAGIVEEGSVDKALRGGHYNRCMRIHKLVYEVLARRMIKKAENEKGLSTALKELIQKFHRQENWDGRKEVIHELLNTDEFVNLVTSEFEEINNSDSEHGKYWLTYMEMVEILLLNYHSLRTQLWDQYLISLRLMCPWLAAYNHVHYTRYLPYYWASMISLEDEVRSHLMNNFSYSLTGNPFSHLPLDQIIEMTMNKGSKLKSGWYGVTRNLFMVNNYCIIVNYIMAARITLEQFTNRLHYTDGHKENTKSRRQADEKAIKLLDACLDEWSCDPWDLSNGVLRSLQSGYIPVKEVAESLKSAKEKGEALISTILRERITTNDVPLLETIHQIKQYSFNYIPKEAKQKSVMNQKTVEMESKAMACIVSLAQNSQLELDMDILMEYHLTDIPLAIFYPNGAMRKSVKSQLRHQFNYRKAPASMKIGAFAILDMGFYWRLASPSKEDRYKGDGSAYTWSDFAQKIFSMIQSRHPGAAAFYITNDRYDIQDNIKRGEHIRRAGGKEGKNIFIRRGDPLPSSTGMSDFYKNASNKIRLQEYLLQEFTKLSRTAAAKFYYNLNEACIDLDTSDHLPQFECHQTEADTKMFYYAAILSDSHPTTPIIIDAEDTDVYVIAAQAAHELEASLLMYKTGGDIYYCKDFCTKEVAEIIIPLHVITGCDTTSGFYYKTKASICKQSIASEETYNLLRGLGDKVNLKLSQYSKLEQFILKGVYGEPTNIPVNQFRSREWTRMKNKNTAKLSPDRDSLGQHFKRTCYQSYIFKSYRNPNAPPPPHGCGWHSETTTGYVVPTMSTADKLPASLQELYEAEDDTHTSDTEPDVPTDESDSELIDSEYEEDEIEIDR